jgi:MraZ protein
MFYGQYHHTLDSKDRMTIPAKFRELVGEGVFVFQGFDHNLMVFTKNHFEILSQQVDGTDLANTDARLMRRLFFATAEWVDMDKAGRILIPGFLKKAAGLDNEVVLVGAGKFFEIWSKRLWEEQSTKLLDIETNVQRLPSLNFPVGA